MSDLNENTVQHTLCIPLWGRKIAAETYPHIFPDHDAGRICQELGVDLSDKLMYKLQYAWVNCMTRQYNLAWEIEEYLKKHPNAIVVEMGAGLSCLRRQMGNETNRWYCLDMENVISLREKHIPKGELENNIVCDLNDFSWFDKIVNVAEKEYMDGYLKSAYKKTWITRLFNRVMLLFHMSFMIHAEFEKAK